MLHRHLGTTSVEESAELTHRLTGEPREVDVVIRETVAGYDVVISVEATVRRADTPYVKAMLQKHAELETDRLVLVAERGFTEPARRLAEMRGVVVITPEALAAADAGASLVPRAAGVRIQGLGIRVARVWAELRSPDGRVLDRITPPSGAPCLQRDGTRIDTFRRSWMDGARLRPAHARYRGASA